MVNAPTLLVAIVCAFELSVTASIICSAPLPSIIISPFLNSVKKAVPKPVIAPPVVIDATPDISLSLSNATSAVKSSSVDVCELT